MPLNLKLNNMKRKSNVPTAYNKNSSIMKIKNEPMD